MKLEEYLTCCLEVKLNGDKFYLTGKHLKPKDSETVALLSPVCYRDFIGVFRHPEDGTKSGIYLDTIKIDSPDHDFSRFVVWRKQTERDPEPEYFATYLRMNLV